MPAKGTHMPEWQKKIVSKTHKGKQVSAETREKISNFAKTRIGEKNPHWGKHHTEEAKRKIGAVHKGKPQSPESNLKRSLTLKGKPKHITPEGMVARILRNTGKNNPQYGKRASYELRLKLTEKRLGGFWYGNVRYNPDTHPYCIKWKDVRNRVKKFFDYTCVKCGKQSRGWNLVGHHVFYERNTCCIVSDDGTYWTNLNSKDHQKKDYCIGTNPNYFVTLCRNCHVGTNGSFENRKKWADYFKNVIDTQYGGQCYLPKED